MSAPTRYRIVQPPAWSGLWTVQGWFADVQVWADIGDAVATRAVADRKLAAIYAANATADEVPS